MVGSLRSRGFTLAETLLAAFLILVALLAVVGVFTTALSLQEQSVEVTQATEAAREVLERTRDLDFDELPIDTQMFDGKQGDSAFNGFPPEPYPSFKRGGRQYWVQVQSRTPHPDAIAIQVSVYWDDTSHVSIDTAFHR